MQADATGSTGAELLAQRFPRGFLFGAATASYQIEGAVTRGRARRVDLGPLQPHARARSATATPATSPATTTIAGATTSR